MPWLALREEVEAEFASFTPGIGWERGECELFIGPFFRKCWWVPPEKREERPKKDKKDKTLYMRGYMKKRLKDPVEHEKQLARVRAWRLRKKQEMCRLQGVKT